MAQITWTAEAERWLEDIFEYVAADNPRAAADTIEGIYAQAQGLKDFPEMGYRYRASTRHVRILLYGHYRITYLIKDDGDIGRAQVPPSDLCRDVGCLSALVRSRMVCCMARHAAICRLTTLWSGP
jgi:toxin ParE1/3/4